MSWLKELAEKLEEYKVARLGAALWFRVGKKLCPTDLGWAVPLVGPDGDRLLWEALEEAAAIACDGILRPGPLARFLEEISTGDSQIQDLYPYLVWTLPSQHPKARKLGGTYAKAIIELIQQAQEYLLMTSPFLQEHAITSLIQALVEALERGVEVTILTQEVDNLASSQSQALEELRREAERLGRHLAVYSSTTQIGSMLHAKLVVADARKMVLGSANLTGPGLGQNLEAGVVLGEKEALEVKLVVEGLILSGLVTLVFDTQKKKS